MELLVLETTIPDLEVVESSKAEQLIAVFKPLAETLNTFEDQFNEITTAEIDEDVTKKAKR